MGDTNFVEVKLSVQNTSIKIEKGCSFENNSAIYYINDKGTLNIFDKKTQTWSSASEIKINNSEFNVFQAVANNTTEQLNNQNIDGIVLSKNDITTAMQQHQMSGLTQDLSEHFSGKRYDIKYAQRYTDANAISATIEDHLNENRQENLIFKFGKTKQTTKLSEFVKSFLPKKQQKAIINQTEPQQPSFIEIMPKYYQTKLKKLSKTLKMSPTELENEIKRASKETGCSSYLIAHIISTEEYEPVVKNKGDGTLTGGFGHTSSLDKSLKKEDKVTPQQAFDWLIEDINFFENQIKDFEINKETGKTYGDYFEEMPSSIKEALIDVAFNRDARKLENAKEYANLRNSIENGDYASAAVEIRQNFTYKFEQIKKHTYTPGLLERNVYRFLLAARELDSESLKIAKEKFNENSYYSNAIEIKKYKGYPLDAKLMAEAWAYFE